MASVALLYIITFTRKFYPTILADFYIAIPITFILLMTYLTSKHMAIRTKCRGISTLEYRMASVALLYTISFPKKLFFTSRTYLNSSIFINSASILILITTNLTSEYFSFFSASGTVIRSIVSSFEYTTTLPTSQNVITFTRKLVLTIITDLDIITSIACILIMTYLTSKYTTSRTEIKTIVISFEYTTTIITS